MVASDRADARASTTHGRHSGLVRRSLHRGADVRSPDCSTPATWGSVAVFVDGEPVVDVWGGFTDTDRTIPWQRDTITNVWSVTKTMTALCALVLADRGDLDLDAPVGRYWPEFAAAGKDRVLVRHLLAHTAGLPDWDGPSRGSLRLAVRHGASGRAGPAMGAGNRGRLPLAHPGVPGRRGRPPDHRPEPGRVLRGRGGRPLDADFPIGLPAEHDPRVALTRSAAVAGRGLRRERAGQARAAAAGVAVRSPGREQRRLASREIPAASGFGNARSVALVQSVMACGGAVRGVRLLSPAGCDRAREEQFSGEDRRLGMPVRWGLGTGCSAARYGLGRLGRLARHDRSRGPHGRGVRDQSDARTRGRHPGAGGRDGRLRRAPGSAVIDRAHGTTTAAVGGRPRRERRGRPRWRPPGQIERSEDERDGEQRQLEAQPEGHHRDGPEDQRSLALHASQVVHDVSIGSGRRT